MEAIQAIKRKFIDLYQRNPRIARITIGLLLLFIANKLYQKRKYTQKLFTTKREVENKAILITGCDTGFGNLIALKLSTKLGYRIIATCLKQESVDKFLSNSSFTMNKSIATTMDVTKCEDIERVKQFTMKYLDETNSILWGLVNNAGFGIPGQFEVVPSNLDALERNVLFNAPINIIRTFLPLLPGRLNYKISDNDNIYKRDRNNGGRIVNVASAAARWIFPEIRYGPSKAALSYFSHVLRMELSPRFGIWVTAIEPAAYNTNIFTASIPWGHRVKKQLEKENKSELMDIYEFDIDKMEKGLKKFIKPQLNNKIEQVVDCVIHGLTAKYPLRRYEPGWDMISRFAAYAPLWIIEPLQLMVAKRAREEMKKL